MSTWKVTSFFLKLFPKRKVWEGIQGTGTGVAGRIEEKSPHQASHFKTVEPETGVEINSKKGYARETVTQRVETRTESTDHKTGRLKSRAPLSTAIESGGPWGDESRLARGSREVKQGRSQCICPTRGFARWETS